MASAAEVGSDLSVPPSFDRIGGGYSDAPPEEPVAGHENGHRALLLAILERALADCRARTSRSPGASGAVYADREEAMHFLCDQRGPRARWRRDLLHLCGLDVEGFDRLVSLERDRWPPLNTEADAAAKERQRLYQADYHRRRQAERRREQARQCMRAKRARERVQPAESYTRPALLVGSGLTRPTYND